MAQRENTDLRIHFINVGYADSILLELPGGAHWLIDAGSRDQAAPLADYLRKQGVRKIDSAIITHPHENHFGGFTELIEQFQIDKFLINGDRNAEDGYQELLQAAREKAQVLPVKRGDRLSDLPPNIEIQVLHPGGLSENLNGNSVALRIVHGKTSILLLGDIDEIAQKELAAIFGQKLQADCILIPHHGMPISEIFSRSFRSPLYILSTGPSQWGLPSSAELGRLSGKLLRTDREGTLIVETDGTNLKVMSAEMSR